MCVSTDEPKICIKMSPHYLQIRMGNMRNFQHRISLYKYMTWWHSAEQYICEINIAIKRCAPEHCTQLDACHNIHGKKHSARSCLLVYVLAVSYNCHNTYSACRVCRADPAHLSTASSRNSLPRLREKLSLHRRVGRYLFQWVSRQEY
jgi:ribosomal protein S30